MLSSMDLSVANRLCRVCATDDQPLTPIFDSFGIQQELQVQIQVCLRIEVREGDLMPAKVCKPCVDKLKTSYELVQLCERGQRELQRRFALLSSNVEHPGSMDMSSGSFHRLTPLDPHESLDLSSPGKCKHVNFDSSNTEDGGSLDILANAVVEHMQVHEPVASTSRSPATHVSAADAAAAGKRALKCEFCDKAFHHTGDLNKHRRCHTGERPYPCLECGKKFAHVSNLLRHRKLHSGERPFSCSTCQRSFSRSDKLVTHNCAAHRRSRGDP